MSNLCVLLLLFAAQLWSFSSASPLPPFIPAITTALSKAHPHLKDSMKALLSCTHEAFDLIEKCRDDTLVHIEESLNTLTDRIRRICYSSNDVADNTGTINDQVRHELNGMLHSAIVLKSWMRPLKQVPRQSKAIVEFIKDSQATAVSPLFQAAYESILVEYNRFVVLSESIHLVCKKELLDYFKSVFLKNDELWNSCFHLMHHLLCTTPLEHFKLLELQRFVMTRLWRAEKLVFVRQRSLDRNDESHGWDVATIRDLIGTKDSPEWSFKVNFDIGIGKLEGPYMTNRLPLDFLSASNMKELQQMVRDLSSDTTNCADAIRQHKVAQSQNFIGMQMMRLHMTRRLAERSIPKRTETVRVKTITVETAFTFFKSREQYHHIIPMTIMTKASTRMHPREAFLLQSWLLEYRAIFDAHISAILEGFDQIHVVNEMLSHQETRTRLQRHLQEVGDKYATFGLYARSCAQDLFGLNQDSIKSETDGSKNKSVYSFPGSFDEVYSPTVMDYLSRQAHQVMSMFMDPDGNRFERLQFRDWMTAAFRKHHGLVRKWQSDVESADAAFTFYYPLIWYKARHFNEQFNSAFSGGCLQM